MKNLFTTFAVVCCLSAFSAFAQAPAGGQKGGAAGGGDKAAAGGAAAKGDSDMCKSRANANKQCKKADGSMGTCQGGACK